MYRKTKPDDRIANGRFLTLPVAALGLIAAALLPAPPAVAQSDEIEEVLVTGSRIVRGNLTQPNPVYGIDAEDIRLSGESNIVDVINRIPALLGSDTGVDSSFFTAPNAAGFDNTPGLATLELRGLGTNRALVLVDGKRHVSGQAGNQAVDVSTVPAALVERVEVLTGGASSIYGADAVAGVVNFIMKEDFEGTELDFRSGSTDNNAREFFLSGVHGMNLFNDRMNISVFGSYLRRDDIDYNDRAFSRNGGIAGRQGNNSLLVFQNGDTIPAGAAVGDPIAMRDDAGNCSEAVPGTDPALVQQACSAAPERIVRNLAFGLTHAGGLLALNLADDITAAEPERATAFPLFHTEDDLGDLAPGTPLQDFDGDGVDDCLESFVGQFSVGGCSIVSPASGSLRPYNPGDVDGQVTNFDAVGGDGFFQNGQPNETLDPDYEQFVFNTLINFEINSSMNLFADIKYVYSETETAGGGIAFFDTINISPENPFVPARAQALLEDILALNPQYADSAQFFLTRDPTDINNDGSYERETFRIVAGIEGELPFGGIDYEVAFNYGKTEEDSNDRALLNDRFFAAVDVVTGPDGGPVCRSEVEAGWTVNDFNNDSIFGDSGVNTFTPGDGSCRPANVFGLGRISPEAQAFIAPWRKVDDEVEQTVVSAIVTGDTESWFNLPGGSIGFAAGAEYRKEESESEPDEFEQAGYYFNSQTAITDGDFDVYEFFGEVSVPVLADRPFFQELTVDASYRYSDYDLDVGDTDSWAYGGAWAPIRDIRFRGTRSRAVRAPNIFELFRPQERTTFNLDIEVCDTASIASLRLSDPATAAQREANCAADPLVGPNFSNPLTSNFPGVTGGNPALIEETADTWTYGVVINPRFLPNFTFTADYWDIEIEDAIQELQDDDIMRGCYDGPSLDPTFCNLIGRVDDPNSAFFGGLNSLQTGQINFAKIETAGWDFEATYDLEALPFVPGSMGFRLNATYLDKLDEFRSTLQPNLADEEKGELRRPEWAGNFYARYFLGGLTVSYQTTYVDDQIARGVESNEVDSVEDSEFSDMWRHDISVDYLVNDTLRLYGGINNFTDEDPYRTEPSYPVGPRGRYTFIGVTVMMQ